jgi:hypothetical protein
MEQEKLEDLFHDLDPALRVLSGGDLRQIRLMRGGSEAGSRVIERYAAVPRLTDPRALLPLDATNLAWPAILGQYAAGAASPLARAAARVLGVANMVGATSVFLRDRVSVVTDRDSLVDTPLHEFLSDVLGRKDFVISLRLAPRRPNGKPVAQVVAHDGEILAYAKFGWEKLTRKLVRREAAVLDELGPLTRGTLLQVPRALYKGQWRDFEALVVAPLAGMGRTPNSLADLPIAASLALADLTPRADERLGSSGFWRRTGSQAAQVGPLLSEHARQIVKQTCGLIENRWGDVRLRMGRSHGDWIPPNISIRVDKGFNVWDWERSESRVPLGIDAMQFILFLELRRRTLGRRLGRRALAHGRDALDRLGLPAKDQTLLMMLSLLRSLLWFGEARQAGRGEDEDNRFAEGLEQLLDWNRESAAVPAARRKLDVSKSANRSPDRLGTETRITT